MQWMNPRGLATEVLSLTCTIKEKSCINAGPFTLIKPPNHYFFTVSDLGFLFYVFFFTILFFTNVPDFTITFLMNLPSLSYSSVISEFCLVTLTR